MAQNDNPITAGYGLARSRHTRQRPDSFHQWSNARVVTFIVTLAAQGNVTLAARQAGMSRKSAYALKDRDPVFASAGQAALGARSTGPARG